MKKLLQTIIVLMVSALSMNAHAKNIGVFYYDSQNAFFEGFDYTLSQMTKGQSYKITVFDGKSDSKIQMKQIKENFSLGSDAIVNLVEIKDANETIDLASKVDAKVVFFNRIPDQSVINSYEKAWYVGSDSADSGRCQYQMILDYLMMHPEIDKNKNGSIDFILLQGEENHSDTKGRTATVIESLQSTGIPLNLVSMNYDNWSYDVAYQDVENQIRHKGINNIEMIIANNDNMALGAVKALNENGYNMPNIEDEERTNYIPVFGVDGIKDAFKAVDSGMLTGTTFCDYSALVKVCLKIIAYAETNDADLEKQIWYKVKDRNVLIPYQNYAKFKNYNTYHSYYGQ